MERLANRSGEKEASTNAQVLAQIFNESPSFMTLTLGPSHVFEVANQRYYDVLRVSPSIIGRTVTEVFPELMAQGFISLLDEAYRTGKAYKATEAKLSLNLPEGGQRDIYVTFAYQPVRDKDGKVYGLIHQGYEVTEAVLARKSIERAKAAVENERQNFRNLFQQTPEMVCILKGPDHVFEFVNEAHIRALGFDATGMPVRKAQPESVEVHGILDNVYRTGETAELHEIPVTLTDRVRYFNLTYAARRDDDDAINGIMILGVEVSDQVMARDSLRQALSARDDFLSIASHELKTPITSMQLQAQTLERMVERGKFSSITPEMLVDHAHKTVRKVRQLTKLVEDMLDVSRINSGKVDYEFADCALEALVTDTADSLADLFRAAKTDITVDVQPARVKADEFRLRQVITNVLTNALKYGRSNPVRVTLRKEPGEAVLEISDRGIGIAPENLSRIFDRFERAVSASTVSGLGLGLFISKQIVEAHGGTISVISQLGGGSTFVVRLPCYDAPTS